MLPDTLCPTPVPRLARRGVSVLECLTSLILLAVTLTMVSQMTFQIDRLSRNRGEQLEASRLLQNTAEQLVSLPWRQVTHDQALTLLTEEAALSGLSNIEPSVSVTPNDTPIAARRVTLTVTWDARGKRAPHRLSLTTEVYRNLKESE